MDDRITSRSAARKRLEREFGEDRHLVETLLDVYRGEYDGAGAWMHQFAREVLGHRSAWMLPFVDVDGLTASCLRERRLIALNGAERDRVYVFFFDI